MRASFSSATPGISTNSKPASTGRVDARTPRCNSSCNAAEEMPSAAQGLGCLRQFQGEHVAQAAQQFAFTLGRAGGKVVHKSQELIGDAGGSQRMGVAHHLDPVGTVLEGFQALPHHAASPGEKQSSPISRLRCCRGALTRVTKSATLCWRKSRKACSRAVGSEPAPSGVSPSKPETRARHPAGLEPRSRIPLRTASRSRPRGGCLAPAVRAEASQVPQRVNRWGGKAHAVEEEALVEPFGCQFFQPPGYGLADVGMVGAGEGEFWQPAKTGHFLPRRTLHPPLGTRLEDAVPGQQGVPAQEAQSQSPGLLPAGIQHVDGAGASR